MENSLYKGYSKSIFFFIHNWNYIEIWYAELLIR